MVKRAIDIIFALIGIIILIPLFIFCFFAIWINDFNNPFYFAERSGKNGKIFCMIKFRTMNVGADKSGVASTAIDDPRITRIGHILRKYKIDELPNLFNIIMGQMSFVGPRPNVKWETDLYTIEEKLLLSIRPGLTDFSSIVFADESDILKGSKDPDLSYNQLIRPWKSRLGIFYVNNRSIWMDIQLMFLTAVAIISKSKSIRSINKILIKFSVDEQLVSVSLRDGPLYPYPPPGSNNIVISRN